MVSNKTMVCIDNGYLSKVLQGHGMQGISNKKLVSIIAKKSFIKDYFVFLYDCMPYQSKSPTPEERERYAKKDKFFSRMRKNGFTVRLGRLQKIGNHFTQKKVDTLWTADIAKMAFRKKMDTIIIITGDSDFVPGVEVAQELGIHTILWYSNTSKTSTSFDLIKTCDEVHKITKQLLHECRRD